MNVEKLQRLMDSMDVKQTQLAEIAGVSQAFMSNMLKGYKTPSVAVLKRISDYFHISIDDLVG